MCRKSRLLLFIALVAPSACSEEGPGGQLFRVGKEVKAVDTSLSKSNSEAGEEVETRCTVTYDDGSSESVPDFSLSVSPSAGDLVTRSTIRPTVAATYQIACVAGGIEDATPASLAVAPAAAARIIAVLPKNSIISKETIQASCRVEDRFGNAVRDVETLLRSEPSRGLEIAEPAITGIIAQEYAIFCRPNDTSRLERIPAALTVLPGPPTRIVAELDHYSVMAGDRVSVSCRMADDSGNAVVMDSEFSVTPTPENLDTSGLVAFKAGEYWVGCSVPDFSLISQPVLLNVGPALPAELEIVGVDPVKSLYAATEIVEPLVTVTDAYGNEVRSATLRLAGLPPDSVLDMGFNQAMLLGDGTITLAVDVISPTHNNLPVGDTIALEVDGRAPDMNWTFPKRAEIVVGQPGASITLRGRVQDAHRVTDLVINGNQVAFDASGNFTAPMATAWGINLIEGTAWDEAGNRRDFVQSFELASTYERASPARTLTGRIDDGLIAHLGQAVLDDNNLDVDDLATIARLAIANTDINALIPNPVTTYRSDCSIPFVDITGALDLHVDRVSYGTPDIDITAITGGLRLRVSIPNLRVDVRTSGDVCEIDIGLRGTATAQRITVSADLLVRASNGRVLVTMPSPSVSITGLELDLDLPSVIDWAVDGILSLFSEMIADAVEDAFADMMVEKVPPVVKDFLESIALDTGFNLPSPLSLYLGVSSGLGTVQFDPVGGNIGFDATIYATGTITPEPRGGILLEQHTIPTFSAARALAVAVGYDLINQALYSVWYGGGLEIDLAPYLPSQLGGGIALKVVARAMLPPVMKPVSDPVYPLELQIGDLALDTEVTGIPGLPPINGTIYATMFARASARVNAAQEVELALSPTLRLSMEFDSSLPVSLDLNALWQALEHALAALAPTIFREVIDNIPLPTFDLSTMAGSYLPPGIVLELGNAQTRFHPSYLILEGNIVRAP